MFEGTRSWRWRWTGIGVSKPTCELLVGMFSMRVKQICLLKMCLCDGRVLFCEIASLRILFGYLTLSHLVMFVDMSLQTNVSDVHLTLCMQLVLIERLDIWRISIENAESTSESITHCFLLWSKVLTKVNVAFPPKRSEHLISPVRELPLSGSDRQHHLISVIISSISSPTSLFVDAFFYIQLVRRSERRRIATKKGRAFEQGAESPQKNKARRQPLMLKNGKEHAQSERVFLPTIFIDDTSGLPCSTSSWTVMLSKKRSRINCLHCTMSMSTLLSAETFFPLPTDMLIPPFTVSRSTYSTDV